MKQRLIIIVVGLVVALLLLAVVEILVIKYSGHAIPHAHAPNGTSVSGQGPELSYVIMGDSTSVGEGADYKNSFSAASVQHLSQTHRVHAANVGVSGAVTTEVLHDQLTKAEAYKPDLVLLAVGANDARKFVGGGTIQTALQQIVDGLKQSNPTVRIVVTGSPAMDAVPRFPWPADKLMGLRTRQVNQAFAPIIAKNHLTFAPVADKTRATFLADPTLFAADKFHPNARGYDVWKPVINDALDQALAKSPL